LHGRVSTTPRMDDPSLVLQRVADGDFGAFESLYDQYHRLVYRIAIGILENEAWAEDVTQDVFTKIWTDPHTFRGGNFAGWISRVARNRTIDLMRLRRLHPESELPDVPRLTSSLHDEVFAKIDGERVRSALRDLPEEQRSLIVLGFFSGLTHDELARHTGVPLGTVKTRIRSGLKKLRSFGPARNARQTITVTARRQICSDTFPRSTGGHPRAPSGSSSGLTRGACRAGTEI